MKNTILLTPALFIALLAGAQTTPDSSQRLTQNTQASVPATAVATDNSLYAAYIAEPEVLKSLTSETLRPEHIFPVLGTYTASGTSGGNVTVTLDSANKGTVWVEGLSQGRFKALMKKAPVTYKIPAQKTESGKDVQEGTLVYQPTSKELIVVLGRPFDDANPASFATATGKQKGWQYTGTKEAAVVPSSSQQ